MSKHFARRALFTATSILLTAAFAACASDNVNNPTVGTTLTANTGVNAQTGTVGQALALPISVHLTDQNGTAVPGVAISWTVTGGGSVDSASSTTNSSGDAITYWTLGTAAGIDSLQAATSNGVSLVITATAAPGPFANLAKVSGDSQAVAAGSAAQPLVVKTVDQYGNGVPGVVVNWSVAGSGTLSTTTTTSDASGLAQVVLTTAATPGGDSVTANAGSAASVTFTLTGS